MSEHSSTLQLQTQLLTHGYRLILTPMPKRNLIWMKYTQKVSYSHNQILISIYRTASENETTRKKKNPSLPQHPQGAKASSTLLVSSYNFLQKYGSQYKNIPQKCGHNRCSWRQVIISHPGRNTQLRVLKLVGALLPQWSTSESIRNS